MWTTLRPIKSIVKNYKEQQERKDRGKGCGQKHMEEICKVQNWSAHMNGFSFWAIKL